jgi:hypothetical protein
MHARRTTLVGCVAGARGAAAARLRRCADRAVSAPPPRPPSWEHVDTGIWLSTTCSAPAGACASTHSIAVSHHGAGSRRPSLVSPGPGLA